MGSIDDEDLGDWLFPPPDPVRFDPVVVKTPEMPVWTASKARLIANYIRLFQYVTHHGTYIDGFAGPQSPDQPQSWAAQMVLGLQPLWLRHFHLCDVVGGQVRELRKLRAQHQKLDIHIYPGDFNQKVNDILRPGVLHSEATFCLLDQRTFECNWETVVKLSRFKAGADTKIELFYFLAQGWFERACSGLGPDGRMQAEAWWGRPDWQTLETMTAWERARAFAQRFQNELGYVSVKPWAIHSSEGDQGRLMYHMIHATDHLEAPKLMARAYAAAVGQSKVGDQLELIAMD